MEDTADTVVPLRPGFDIQVRGFNRNQVMEHIELLEDQLKLVTLDRNEAVALNTDLRRLCDDARHDLSEAEQQLKRIESSDTGLPAASQRVQNMLAIAEDEVQTLRDQAKRQAQTIRGSAENEARELISEAEKAANELRAECSDLTTEVAKRHDQLRREHAKNVRDLREREQRMRQAVRDEYKKMIERGQQESDDLLAHSRRQCGQWEAETEQHRLEALEEIDRKRTELDDLRQSVLAALDSAKGSIDGSALSEPNSSVEQSLASEQSEVRLPEQRDDVHTFSIPLDQPDGADQLGQHNNGTNQAAQDSVSNN